MRLSAQTRTKSLQSSATDQLVVAGMMTSMCVDSTVGAAAELGYGVTLVHDACAAPDLIFSGTIPAASAHAAFVASLGADFAKVADGHSVVASVALHQ